MAPTAKAWTHTKKIEKESEEDGYLKLVVKIPLQHGAAWCIFKLILFVAISSAVNHTEDRWSCANVFSVARAADWLTWYLHTSSCSYELRELESKLKAGYMNRERAAQIAEKQAIEAEEQVNWIVLVEIFFAPSLVCVIGMSAFTLQQMCICSLLIGFFMS